MNWCFVSPAAGRTPRARSTLSAIVVAVNAGVLGRNRERMSLESRTKLPRPEGESFQKLLRPGGESSRSSRNICVLGASVVASVLVCSNRCIAEPADVEDRDSLLVSNELTSSRSTDHVGVRTDSGSDPGSWSTKGLESAVNRTCFCLRFHVGQSRLTCHRLPHSSQP